MDRSFFGTRLNLKSIHFKLVGISVVIFGIATIALTALLYRGVGDAQQIGFDTALHNYAVDVSGGFDVNFLGGLVLKKDAILEENKLFPFALGQSIVQFRTMSGNVLLTSRSFDRALPISKDALDAAARDGFSFETYTLGANPKDRAAYRIINYLVKKDSLPPLILQVAAPLALIESERRQILPLIYVLIPLALLTAAVLGFFLSTRALKPVYRIIDTAKAIRPEQLSSRVPVPEETEMKELAITLNDLLARLQMAFESQERFIADASHQLKTPLAIVRGEIDVFRKISRSPEESNELLLSISQEVNQLSKVVDDLLLLARFDSGGLKPTFAKVRMDEVVLETIAQLDRFARDQSVMLDFHLDAAATDFEAVGDTDLIKALLFNLIENAIKYSAKPGGRAMVELMASDPHEITLSVSDNGPGITVDERERVFDRFFRGSQRQHLIAGVGLGLSIAKRIANLHSGKLIATSWDETPGAVFILTLPRH